MGHKVLNEMKIKIDVETLARIKELSTRGDFARISEKTGFPVSAITASIRRKYAYASIVLELKNFYEEKQRVFDEVMNITN